MHLILILLLNECGRFVFGWSSITVPRVSLWLEYPVLGVASISADLFVLLEGRSVRYGRTVGYP